MAVLMGGVKLCAPLDRLVLPRHLGATLDGLAMSSRKWQGSGR